MFLFPFCSHFVPILAPLWGSCSHFVPILFALCSHSCPALGFLFPLCSHFVLILAPCWGSCSHFVRILAPLCGSCSRFVPIWFLFLPHFRVLVSTLFLFLPHFRVLVPALFPFGSHSCPTLGFLFPLCSHSCPTLGFLFPLCSHSCPALGSCSHFVPTLFPLCSHFVPTLFPFLPNFRVLVPTLFPLCSRCVKSGGAGVGTATRTHSNQDGPVHPAASSALLGPNMMSSNTLTLTTILNGRSTFTATSNSLLTSSNQVGFVARQVLFNKTILLSKSHTRIFSRYKRHFVTNKALPRKTHFLAEVLCLR